MSPWAAAVLALMALLFMNPVRRIWLSPISIKLDAHAKWAGNAAQMASAFISLIGFTVVIYQIQESRQKAIQDSIRAELGDARRLYLTYSDAALRYPHLTQPNYSTLLRDPVEFARYESFVDHLVYAYDDILHAVKQYEEPADIASWEATFKRDTLPHRRYLCQIDQEFYAQYRAIMGDRIKAIIEPCDGAEPLIRSPSPAQRPRKPHR